MRCIGSLDGALYDFLPCFKGSLISSESNLEAYYIWHISFCLNAIYGTFGASATELCNNTIKAVSTLTKAPLFDVNLLTLQ